MARRLRRSGPASSPTVTAVLAAAVLVAALVLSGRALDHRGGQRRPPTGVASAHGTATTRVPYRAGEAVRCPSPWPVLAMSNHASYPAGHPARPPPGARPVACFRTSADAASAGYGPVPLPAGTQEVGGIYLAPTSRGFRASCQRAAARLGFAVPCPGMLPTAPPGAPPPRLCDHPGACRRGQVLRFVQGAFVAPPGYVGAPGGFSALSVVAAPVDGPAFRCHEERRIATPTVQRARGVMAACLDAPHRSVFGGSVLLRWSQRGTLVVVSVLDWNEADGWSDTSRWSEVNQRLAIAVAAHVRLAEPAR